MPPSKSLKLEQHIIEIFSKCRSFTFNGVIYTVEKVGKPRPSQGECKTDVYVKAVDADQNPLELKISVKDKSTNEFQGNKLKQEDASSYFGVDWADIIKKASSSIKPNFENRPLVFAKGKHPTQINSITLGWKLEIANKARALSAKIPLTLQEVRDYVFKGAKLSKDKKNAKVNGVSIKDSGIAGYLLITDIDEIQTVNDITSKMQPIDTYTPPQIYLVFTANNYRTVDKKADGPRSLAVQIEWICENGKLNPNFIYNRPLQKTGENDMKPILLEALRSLGKSNPDKMDKNDVVDEKFLYI